MGQLSSRIYQAEKDFQIILDLMTSIRPAEHLNDYPVKVDIEENLASAVTRGNTRLWFDDEQPIAWAFVDEFSNLRWDLDPQYEDRIDAELVAWGESCIRKTFSDKELRTLDTSCREDYAQRIVFLEQFGFHQTEDLTIRMMRDLSRPIPEPKLPLGFSIRPITGTQEAAAVAAMHRAAFGTDSMTTENRLTIMNTSEYDPSLDLIVVAPDGTVAANCICSVNEASKIGNTDPVATHPKYQRLGLARALLLTGLRLLKGGGMFFAQLGTSGDNAAMQRTAESVGFKIEYKTIWFAKEVN